MFDGASVAAIKPTVGRVSRHGVIPITADQDTAGPMARTVTDVAILLGALEGAAPDPDDPATRHCTPPAGRDYTRFLNPRALQGARIGIPRAFFYDKVTPPGAKEPRGGLSDDGSKTMAEAKHAGGAWLTWYTLSVVFFVMSLLSKAAGITLHRATAVNDQPEFIAALTDVVRRAMRAAA